MCPTSEQWGMPRIEPLYPVDKIVLSRTITAPTNLRGQVDRLAVTAAMFMKYWSQETRPSDMPHAYHFLVRLGCETCARDAYAQIDANPKVFPLNFASRYVELIFYKEGRTQHGKRFKSHEREQAASDYVGGYCTAVGG